MAEAARLVVASGPPPGVTWRHPGEMDEASRSFWISAERADQPVLHLSPREMDDFLADVWRRIKASETPESIAAQNLQCRMAALHPTWSARPALFFGD